MAGFLDRVEGDSERMLMGLGRYMLNTGWAHIEDSKDRRQRLERLLAFYKKNPYLLRLMKAKMTHPKDFAKLFPEYAHFDNYNPVNNPEIMRTFERGLPQEIDALEASLEPLQKRDEYITKLKQEHPTEPDIVHRVARELERDDPNSVRDLQANGSKYFTDIDQRHDLFKKARNLGKYYQPGTQATQQYKDAEKYILDRIDQSYAAPTPEMPDPSLTLRDPEFLNDVGFMIQGVGPTQKLLAEKMRTMMKFGYMDPNTGDFKLTPMGRDLADLMVREKGWMPDDAYNEIARDVASGENKYAFLATVPTRGVADAYGMLGRYAERGASDPEARLKSMEYLKNSLIPNMPAPPNRQQARPMAAGGAPVQPQQPAAAPPRTGTAFNAAPAEEPKTSTPPAGENILSIMRAEGIVLSPSGKFFDRFSETPDIPLDRSKFSKAMKDIGRDKGWDDQQSMTIGETLKNMRYDIYQKKPSLEEFIKNYDPGAKDDLKKIISDQVAQGKSVDDLAKQYGAANTEFLKKFAQEEKLVPEEAAPAVQTPQQPVPAQASGLGESQGQIYSMLSGIADDYDADTGTFYKDGKPIAHPEHANALLQKAGIVLHPEQRSALDAAFGPKSPQELKAVGAHISSIRAPKTPEQPSAPAQPPTNADLTKNLQQTQPSPAPQPKPQNPEEQHGSE